MDNMNEVRVTAWADVDFEIGHAVYFEYYNTLPISPLGLHAAKPYHADITTHRTLHGVAVTPAKAGELVTVRLATAGTIALKVDWTGTLLPGTNIYPPLNVDGVMSASTAPAHPQNVLGMYVGAEALPESDSGSRIEVLILRIAPNISSTI